MSALVLPDVVVSHWKLLLLLFGLFSYPLNSKYKMQIQWSEETHFEPLHTLCTLGEPSPYPHRSTHNIMNLSLLSAMPHHPTLPNPKDKQVYSYIYLAFGFGFDHLKFDSFIIKWSSFWLVVGLDYWNTWAFRSWIACYFVCLTRNWKRDLVWFYHHLKKK